MDEFGVRTYTDEEIFEYVGKNIELETASVDLFLDDCKDFEDDIIALSTSLNEKDISMLYINNDINMLIDSIKDLKEYRNKLVMSLEEEKVVNQRFDKLIENLVLLKKKHLHIYNTKVEYINTKVSFFVDKLNKDVVSKNVRELIDKLSLIDKCEVNLGDDWKQNKYLDTLDYNKMNGLYEVVEKLDKILNIRTNEPLDLFSSVNYVENSIRKIRRDMKEEMSLISLNSSLDRCITLLERVTDLDIKHELMRDKLSKEMFSKYSSKIKKLRKDIKDVEEKLLDNKSSLVRKNNFYALICNKLEQLDHGYDMLDRKILEYEGKCTSKTVAVFNNYLDNLRSNVFELEKMFKEYDEKELLTQEQKDYIYKKMVILSEKHINVSSKCNDNMILLKEEEKENFTNDKIANYEKMLKELEDKISKLDKEKIIKNEDVRNEITTFIKDREEKIIGLEHLLSYYEVYDTNKYNKEKVIVDKLRNRFDSVSDKFYDMCPLKVKSVRNAKKLYKKYPKLGLISAGLSTLALLNSGFTLIPAIMYGNSIISGSMMNMFNKILGSAIGATFNNGVWKLASGALLDASAATVSILKSIATFSAGVVAVISPMFVPQIIMLTKKLVDKIKKSELKAKTFKEFEKGKEKVKNVAKVVTDKTNQVKRNINAKEIDLHYKKLYNIYCENKTVTLDKFCEENKLSDRDKKILQLMEDEEYLEELKKQEFLNILNEENKVRS